MRLCMTKRIGSYMCSAFIAARAEFGYNTAMRRRFLSFVLILPFFAACRKSPEPPRTGEALGTVCTVNAFADGTAALYDELFARLRQIDGIFSATDAQSELSAVNRAAGERAVSVSGELFSVVQAALRVSALTDGAFDCTVGPLVSLWGIATDHARVPSDAERESARSLVGWRDCVLSAEDSSVFLAKKGMALDLGGIAKGYAADVLADILRARKVRRAVINLGGTIYVVGTKADGTPWRVGVKNPDDPQGGPALALDLGEVAVVTSGDYERFFEQDGIRYHHILDPKTGFPARTDLRSVTVVHQSALLADALTTAFFVLGMDKSRELAQRLGIGAVFIAENHAVSATDDLAQNVVLF